MKSKVSKLIRFAQTVVAVSAMVVLGWTSYELVVYLRTARPFEVQKLSVLGARRVRESQVLAKVGFEAGTNVFRANLDEIRRSVEELDWVRYASVQRVLPDQIIIRLVEREPIGLTRIQSEIYQFDADGKILDIDSPAGANFPILDGLRAGDRKGNQQKVETYRKVMEEVGQTSLSEIHINEAGEVTVVSASEPVSINLGAGDFRNRWVRYLQLRPQIQQQYPEAVRVDLRFKNQVIIKMTDDDAGEKMVWGAKKSTL
jgi:cell division protein FtsQ